ncbi:MAG: hypothetical protein HWQ23_15215 [Nostoc sp. JL33]|uniref:hypothetical protein n=1 Tax=Nostoc sp. JL33 TaxID=2815396 RepID=UPI0025DDCFA7|nr:hypothetical protein [Nostoc sp. JL33]MBN3871574.1 hypothetical protein [Nostoc sp. JL33]
MIKDIQSLLFSTYMMWVVFDFTRAIAPPKILRGKVAHKTAIACPKAVHWYYEDSRLRSLSPLLT